MKQEGLFNEEVEMNVVKVVRGQYADFKRENHFRKGHLRNCCKWCEHLRTVDTYGKKYFKCKMMGISSSAASDVRASSLCDKFEELM